MLTLFPKKKKKEREWTKSTIQLKWKLPDAGRGREKAMKRESPETGKLCSIRVLYMMRVIFHISEKKNEFDKHCFG